MAPRRPITPAVRGVRGVLEEISASAYVGTASGLRVKPQVDMKSSRDQGLPAREAVKEEAIVIDSDSDSIWHFDESDDGEGSDGNDGAGIGSRAKPASSPLASASGGSSARAVKLESGGFRASTAGLPTIPRRFSGWDDVDLKTPTNKTARYVPGNGLLSKGTDTTSASVISTLPNGTQSTRKGMGLAHGQSVSSEKDTNTTGRRSLGTAPALTLSNDSGQTHVSKSLFDNKADDAEGNKKDVKPGISQQQQQTTATVSTVPIDGNRNSIPSSNSASIPPTFPPAVKARVYGTSRPAAQRNAKGGSNNLEAFGFVSAASLVSRNDTATTRNTTAVTPTPTLEAGSISHSKPKHISQTASKRLKLVKEEAKNDLSSPRITQNTSAPLTPARMVEAKPPSKSTQRGTAQSQKSDLQPTPRTPENRITVKQEPTLSSSLGTKGDPYAISSDSDNDSDDDSSVISSSPHPIKSLSSFNGKLEVYETASDVEAVLDQFPVWLESPSPAELGSSYSSMPTPVRPILPAQPSKTDDAGTNPCKEGREKRRIRFSGDDGFSPSPSPTKRTAVLEKSSYSPAAVARQIASASHLEWVASRNERMNTPGLCSDSRKRMDLNLILNPTDNQDLPLGQEKSTATKMEEKIVKKERKNRSRSKRIERKNKKKRKAGSSANKAACRYRNRHREMRRSTGQMSTV
ncbi:hypothetical protein F5Y01DRAFT_298121 [Xylaria sp. FL0043]|nr:hypothetical protein F5Y01DRAFT_298121 [Xylaria sp. FL0043]